MHFEINLVLCSVRISGSYSAVPFTQQNRRYHDGCKIRSSSNVHKYFDSEGNATLALVNQDCTGSYTCVATNEGGENAISVSVDPVGIGEKS